MRAATTGSSKISLVSHRMVVAMKPPTLQSGAVPGSALVGTLPSSTRAAASPVLSRLFHSSTVAEAGRRSSLVPDRTTHWRSHLSKKAKRRRRNKLRLARKVAAGRMPAHQVAVPERSAEELARQRESNALLINLMNYQEPPRLRRKERLAREDPDQLAMQLESGELDPSLDNWDRLIRALGQHNRFEDAVACFARVRSLGMTPTESTFNSLIGACGEQRNVSAALEVVEAMREQGLEPTERTYGVLMQACVESAEPMRAMALLKDAERDGIALNNVHFSTVMTGLIRGGERQRVFDLYIHMRAHHCLPDVGTYTALITACARLDQVEKAERYFEDMKEDGIRPNRFAWNALIHACARSMRHAHKAHEYIEQMKASLLLPDLYTFRSALLACSHEGDTTKARSYMAAMAEEGIVPDADTVNALLAVYSRAVHPATTRRVAHRREGVRTTGEQTDDERAVANRGDKLMQLAIDAENEADGFEKHWWEDPSKIPDRGVFEMPGTRQGLAKVAQRLLAHYYNNTNPAAGGNLPVEAQDLVRKQQEGGVEVPLSGSDEHLPTQQQLLELPEHVQWRRDMLEAGMSEGHLQDMELEMTTGRPDTELSEPDEEQAGLLRRRADRIRAMAMSKNLEAAVHGLPFTRGELRRRERNRELKAAHAVGYESATTSDGEGTRERLLDAVAAYVGAPRSAVDGSGARALSRRIEELDRADEQVRFSRALDAVLAGSKAAVPDEQVSPAAKKRAVRALTMLTGTSGLRRLGLDASGAEAVASSVSLPAGAANRLEQAVGDLSELSDLFAGGEVAQARTEADRGRGILGYNVLGAPISTDGQGNLVLDEDSVKALAQFPSERPHMAGMRQASQIGDDPGEMFRAVEASAQLPPGVLPGAVIDEAAVQRAADAAAIKAEMEYLADVGAQDTPAGGGPHGFAEAAKAAGERARGRVLAEGVPGLQRALDSAQEAMARTAEGKRSLSVVSAQNDADDWAVRVMAVSPIPPGHPELRTLRQMQKAARAMLLMRGINWKEDVEAVVLRDAADGVALTAPEGVMDREKLHETLKRITGVDARQPFGPGGGGTAFRFAHSLSQVAVHQLGESESDGGAALDRVRVGSQTLRQFIEEPGPDMDLNMNLNHLQSDVDTDEIVHVLDDAQMQRQLAALVSLIPSPDTIAQHGSARLFGNPAIKTTQRAGTLGNALRGGRDTDYGMFDDPFASDGALGRGLRGDDTADELEAAASRMEQGEYAGEKVPHTSRARGLTKQEREEASRAIAALPPVERAEVLSALEAAKFQGTPWPLLSGRVPELLPASVRRTLRQSLFGGIADPDSRENTVLADKTWMQSQLMALHAGVQLASDAFRSGEAGQTTDEDVVIPESVAKAFAEVRGSGEVQPLGQGDEVDVEMQRLFQEAESTVKSDPALLAEFQQQQRQGFEREVALHIRDHRQGSILAEHQDVDKLTTALTEVAPAELEDARRLIRDGASREANDVPLPPWRLHDGSGKGVSLGVGKRDPFQVLRGDEALLDEPLLNEREPMVPSPARSGGGGRKRSRIVASKRAVVKIDDGYEAGGDGEPVLTGATVSAQWDEVEAAEEQSSSLPSRPRMLGSALYPGYDPCQVVDSRGVVWEPVAPHGERTPPGMVRRRRSGLAIRGRSYLPRPRSLHRIDGTSVSDVMVLSEDQLPKAQRVIPRDRERIKGYLDSLRQVVEADVEPDPEWAAAVGLLGGSGLGDADHVDPVIHQREAPPTTSSTSTSDTDDVSGGRGRKNKAPQTEEPVLPEHGLPGPLVLATDSLAAAVTRPSPPLQQQSSLSPHSKQMSMDERRQAALGPLLKDPDLQEAKTSTSRLDRRVVGGQESVGERLRARANDPRLHSLASVLSENPASELLRSLPVEEQLEVLGQDDLAERLDQGEMIGPERLLTAEERAKVPIRLGAGKSWDKVDVSDDSRARDLAERVDQLLLDHERGIVSLEDEEVAALHAVAAQERHSRPKRWKSAPFLGLTSIAASCATCGARLWRSARRSVWGLVPLSAPLWLPPSRWSSAGSV
jgi:pentatricopeptide repeat protein